jgi:hypothetical protein
MGMGSEASSFEKSQFSASSIALNFAAMLSFRAPMYKPRSQLETSHWATPARIPTVAWPI